MASSPGSFNKCLVSDDVQMDRVYDKACLVSESYSINVRIWSVTHCYTNLSLPVSILTSTSTILHISLLTLYAVCLIQLS